MDPDEPIERIDPTEPIDRIDPTEPIDSSDCDELRDQRDGVRDMLSAYGADPPDAIPHEG